MSIDISGGMILGAPIKGIKLFKDSDIDVGDWLYEHKMEHMSPYYDCEREYWIIGFGIEDVLVEDMDQKWLDNIKSQAEKFEKLTGVKAKLIGMQNVF